MRGAVVWRSRVEIVWQRHRRGDSVSEGGSMSERKGAQEKRQEKEKRREGVAWEKLGQLHFQSLILKR